MEIPKGHPYWAVRSVIEGEPDVEFLIFSYYNYIPQAIQDERIIFQVTREDFLSEKHVSKLLNGGDEDCELSIHSTVVLRDGREKHLPMIDMSTSSKAHLKKIEPFIGWDLFEQFVWFDSGRSFHGYGRKFLSKNEWVALMGSLLLSNVKDMKPIVDPRWIGHRLLAGYSTLRWTNRTKFYLGKPSKIAERP